MSLARPLPCASAKGGRSPQPDGRRLPFADAGVHPPTRAPDRFSAMGRPPVPEVFQTARSNAKSPRHTSASVKAHARKSERACMGGAPNGRRRPLRKEGSDNGGADSHPQGRCAPASRAGGTTKRVASGYRRAALGAGGGATRLPPPPRCERSCGSADAEVAVMDDEKGRRRARPGGPGGVPRTS